MTGNQPPVPIISQPEVKVVCYRHRKPIKKDEAFYITTWDIYLCYDCYDQIVTGKLKVKEVNTPLGPKPVFYE